MIPAVIRRAAAIMSLLLIAGCSTLPRSGPTIQEITAQPADGSDAVEIIGINDAVARLTQFEEVLAFSPDFVGGRVENIELIRPLDILDITVWENGEFPLYGTIGGPTLLVDMRVDLNGFIFMPQVGRLQAAGLTIEQLRQTLTRRLAPMTPEPQVEVRLQDAQNNTVRVFGSEGALGDFPIEAGTRTLAGLIANAGAAGVDPEVAQVSVRRGGQVERVWLQDIYTSPSADIALRGGDVINIERDPRSFSALGEFGTQTQVDFPGRDISLMEAIARLGGLNGSTANPRGVFVLRAERPEIYNRFGQRNVAAPVRVAYVMDLTRPAAFFTAANFAVRDGDIVFVSEAPYVQFLKIIGSLAPPINQVNSTANLLSGNAF